VEHGGESLLRQKIMPYSFSTSASGGISTAFVVDFGPFGGQASTGLADILIVG
jgi:hypothetical protein